MTLRLLLTAAVVLLFTLPGGLRADPAMFSAHEGVAIGGFDAVAFHERGAAEPGSRSHAVMWKGVTWRFASADSRARFEANPRAYSPAFGGYCAYAMSQGYLAEGDPQLWVLWRGRLYMLNNPRVLDIWLTQRAEMVPQAQQHWPAILRR